MINSNNYSQVTVNGEPFWEKPPLFFWIQSTFIKFFDNTEFAARLVSAIFGILTTCLIFIIGSIFISSKFGLIWSFLYSSSCLSLFVSKMGIMDPTLNFFILLGIFTYLQMCNQKNYQYLYLITSSISISIAFLIKGPIAIIISFLVFILYFFLFERSQFNLKNNIIFFLFICLFSSSWYLIESFKNGF